MTAHKSGSPWELTELTAICLNPMEGSITQFADVSINQWWGAVSTTFYFIVSMSRYFLDGKEITQEQAMWVLDNNAKRFSGDLAKLTECKFVTIIN